MVSETAATAARTPSTSARRWAGRLVFEPRAQLTCRGPVQLGVEHGLGAQGVDEHRNHRARQVELLRTAEHVLDTQPWAGSGQQVAAGKRSGRLRISWRPP